MFFSANIFPILSYVHCIVWWNYGIIFDKKNWFQDFSDIYLQISEDSNLGNKKMAPRENPKKQKNNNNKLSDRCSPREDLSWPALLLSDKVLRRWRRCRRQTVKIIVKSKADCQICLTDCHIRQGRCQQIRIQNIIARYVTRVVRSMQVTALSSQAAWYKIYWIHIN